MPHRYTPGTMDDVKICLYYCAEDMKVETKGDVPVVAKTVADLRLLSTWPRGLVLIVPKLGERFPESVVEVDRAS
jgi:hypothetical protein